MLVRSSSTSLILCLLLSAAGRLGACSTASFGYGGLELGRGVALDGLGNLKAATAAAAAAAVQFRELSYYSRPVKKAVQHGEVGGQGMSFQPVQGPEASSPLVSWEAFLMVCGTVGMLLLFVHLWDAWQSEDTASIAPPLRRNVGSRRASASNSSDACWQLSREEAEGDGAAAAGVCTVKEVEGPASCSVPSKQEQPPAVVRRRSSSARQHGRQSRSSEVGVGGSSRQAHGGSVIQPKSSRSDRRGRRMSRKGFLGRHDHSASTSAHPAPFEDEEEDFCRTAGSSRAVQEEDAIHELPPRPSTSPKGGSSCVEENVAEPSAGFLVGMWSGGIWGSPGRGPPLPPFTDFFATLRESSWPWDSPRVSSYRDFLGTAVETAASEQAQRHESPPPDDSWGRLEDNIIQNLLACPESEDDWKSLDSSNPCSSVSSGTDTDGGSVPCSPRAGSKVTPFGDDFPGARKLKARPEQVGVIGQGLAFCEAVDRIGGKDELIVTATPASAGAVSNCSSLAPHF